MDEYEIPRRMFERVSAAPAAPDYGEAFARVDRSNGGSGGSSGLSSLIADLNAYRSQQLDQTYDSNGQARNISSNTILVGYG